MRVEQIRWLNAGLVMMAILLALPAGNLFARNTAGSITVESGLYYTIQKGDTLWDVATRLYGTPAAWPQLWRLNPQIPNPHRLTPGMKIRIFQQKQTQYVAPARKTPVSSVGKPPAAPFYNYTSIDQTGFIRRNKIASVGKIFAVKFSSQNEKHMIQQDDIVYIQAAKGVQFIPGASFTIFRAIPSVRNPATGAYVGTQYYLTGIAEIVGLEKGYATARILRSFRAISVNDQLMPYAPRSPKIILTRSAPNIDGYILGAEEHMSNFGDDTVVFIDKGQRDHIKPGQRYTIYAQKPYRQATVDVRLGTLLVIGTEKTTATVLIVQADKSIRAGAHFRTPLP